MRLNLISSRPLLGGELANPAVKYDWFDTALLRKYPYFLPGAVSGAMTLFAVLVGYFLLKEVSFSKSIR